MKHVLLILILLAVGGGLFYGLGKEGPAKSNAPQERGRRSGERGERTVSVEVAKVEVGEAEETLKYGGSLMPHSSVELFAKVEGRLERLFVDVGDRVKQGDLIGRIEKDEISELVREAQAALEVARATLKGKEVEMRNLERQMERSEELFKRQLIARQELDTIQTQVLSARAQTELAKAQVAMRQAVLESAQIRLRHTDVYSPISGFVGKKMLHQGAMVKTSTPIVSLVNLDPVRTVISLVEKDYAVATLGVPATISVDAYPGQSFGGKVVRISPVMDRDTRTADIEIEIPNPHRLLKPGMYARVTLTLQKREKVFMVPQSALARKGDVVGVFKVGGDRRRVKFVPVEIGMSSDGKVEVIRGVTGGDLIVTLGTQFLEDGARVRVFGSAGTDKF